MSDLPRPVVHPAPARRWRPSRPGDFSSPEDVPSGPAFGTTGPDPGYAILLAGTLDLVLGPEESEYAARSGVAAVAGARAARAGRAPMMQDVEVAALILGYTPNSVSVDLFEELLSLRRTLLANIDHSASQARALIARVPRDILDEVPSRIRSRLAVGERLLV